MAAQSLKDLLLVHDYFLGVQLGKGSFGTVFLCTHLTTNEAFAVKVLSLNSSQMEDLSHKQRVLREIEVMKRLNHPFVVRLHQVISTDAYLFIIMELVFGIDLYDQISSKKERVGGMEEDLVQLLFYQLCCALDYMHCELGIIHRDVKPENILVCNRDHETVIKLVDFGLSKSANQAGAENSFVGTARYIAPEVLTVGEEEKQRRLNGDLTMEATARATYSTPADCYSAGICLFVMLTNVFPKFCEGEIVLKTKRPIPAPAQDLIYHLTRNNPEARYSMKQAMQHPWLSACSAQVERILGKLTSNPGPSDNPHHHSRKRVALVRTPSDRPQFPPGYFFNALTTTTAASNGNLSARSGSNYPSSWSYINPWNVPPPSSSNSSAAAAAATSASGSAETTTIGQLESEFWQVCLIDPNMSSQNEMRTLMKTIRHVLAGSERILYKSAQTATSALEVINDVKFELQSTTASDNNEYLAGMLAMLFEWLTELKEGSSDALKGFTGVLRLLSQVSDMVLASDLSHQVEQLSLGAGKQVKSELLMHFERMESRIRMQESFWAQMETALHVLQQRARIITTSLKYLPRDRLTSKLHDYFSLWQDGASLLLSQQKSSYPSNKPAALSTVVVENETSPPVSMLRTPSINVRSTVVVTKEASPPASHQAFPTAMEDHNG
ncbi:hypothetical protein BASA81_003985 [Batrachochytrium salamandrivorans]|nr:hypothetical protein BASA81_003985 [Batrachochytrium salamandrivorans]